MKVVHVKWVDPAFAQTGWMDKEDLLDFIDKGLTPADSVGLLAYECPEFIVLVQSVGRNQVADAVKIVRSCIRQITELGWIDIDLKLSE